MQITPRQQVVFDIYRDLLITQGARYNLTSLRDPGAIQRRHFDESLAFLEAVEDAGILASPAIDIGTGAGLPGVPIAIVRPDLALTLLEATVKKAVFLEQAVSALGLERVAVVN